MRYICEARPDVPRKRGPTGQQGGGRNPGIYIYIYIYIYLYPALFIRGSFKGTFKGLLQGI